MQTKSRTSHAAALWGALALLLLAVGLELWTEAKLTEIRTLVLRTHEVGRCIQRLQGEVVEAVAARRGHALNPAPALEAEVGRALANVRRDQTRLHVLAAEDESQQGRLDRLDPKIVELLDEISEATRTRADRAFDLASEQRLLERENALKNSSGAMLEDLREAELRLLLDRQALSRRVSYQARGIESLGVVLSIWLLLVVYRTLRREIALREQSEHALRESESRLGITLDSIGDGVVVTDTQARVTRMNPVAERLTGMSLAEARGRPFSEVFPLIDERTQGPADDPVSRVLREGIGVELANHTALRAKDGVVRPIADSAAPMRDDNGELTGVVMVFRDISEERQTARRAREATAFLDSIVENLPNMVFVKEPRELRFVRFNKAGEELLGTPRSTLIGKNDFDLFTPAQAQFFQEKDRDVLTRRTLLDIAEEPIKTPAGERWLHTKKIPIMAEDGTPLYLLGISEDITEKKAIAEALIRANSELEERVEQRTRDLRDANDELTREMNERRQSRGRAADERATAASIAEDGGDRTTGRWRRPRLQQPAVGDLELRRSGVARLAARQSDAGRDRADHARRRAGGRSDEAAARL